MRSIHANCGNVVNEDCSRIAHDNVGLKYSQTEDCVKNSFSSEDWGSIDTINTIIDDEIDYWRKYGGGLFPSVVINNDTYKGQLEPTGVFNAICAGFEKD